MLTGLAENRIVRFLGSDGVALAFKVAYLPVSYTHLPPIRSAMVAAPCRETAKTPL